MCRGRLGILPIGVLTAAARRPPAANLTNHLVATQAPTHAPKHLRRT